MARREDLAEGVTLYLGDCRDVLPTLGKVDAVICDPPYGIGFQYEGHIDDVASYPDLMRSVVSLCDRHLDGGPAVFWQAMLQAGNWHKWFPAGFRIFAACKGFVQFRPTPIQYAWDPVIFWGKPRVEPSVERRDYHFQMLAPFGAGRPRIDHPCPRPLEQVVQVVETFSVLDDDVLDPFMGSGTTGVACVRLGRRFIGIEIEERYFSIACRRIEDELRRPRLALDVPPKPQQEALGI